MVTKRQAKRPCSRNGRLLRRLLVIVAVVAFHQAALGQVFASAYNFLHMTMPGSTFAIDPDLMIRRIDPYAPDKLWTLAEGWGLPPLFYHTSVPGKFERADFIYPLGYREESAFRSKLKFVPFFENTWSKIPPFDGFSRCLTLYTGRSDLGQDYWGFFPLYGYTYRKFGMDSTFFLLFPLYANSVDDDVVTHRVLWPIITYADSPGRQAVKVWPLFGKDNIRADYSNTFLLWPLFQFTEKYPGTPQELSYTACPFPLFVRTETRYSGTTEVLWPFFSYYHHYKSGHKRYSFFPLFSYGTGGGIEELNLFYLYTYKRDRNKGTVEGTGQPRGYVSVGADEVFTERKFLMISSISKRYRRGELVRARYKLWPFAEYTWDAAEGSHLKAPVLIDLKNDWYDLTLGRLLRFVDFRDTPVTRELSLLFGLSQRTEIKPIPHIPPPPKPGDDSWSELVCGAFGKR